MKPVTVDMLRAHLVVASLTAMGAEALALLALLLLPVSQHDFGSTPFRMMAIALMVCGVIVLRQVARAAFELAIQRHYAMPAGRAWPVSIATGCPRRWLVILHLRLTGRAFVVVES